MVIVCEKKETGSLWRSRYYFKGENRNKKGYYNYSIFCARTSTLRRSGLFLRFSEVKDMSQMTITPGSVVGERWKMFSISFSKISVLDMEEIEFLVCHPLDEGEKLMK